MRVLGLVPGEVGKYSLVNNQKLYSHEDEAVRAAMGVLVRAGLIEFGGFGSKDEFFVLKLKDIHSKPALEAYADSVLSVNRLGYASDVISMADRAGSSSLFCKEPD